jgi:addiction module RelE/StbE family toxin
VLTLIWSETALHDLDTITEYIGRYSPSAAFRLQAEIETCAERLSSHPYMYRTGRVPETREAVVHPNYLVVYRVKADMIEIVNVMHTRRQYPPSDDA